jgi:hypothetical protein
MSTRTLLIVVAATSFGCSVDVDNLFGQADDGQSGGRGQGGAPGTTTGNPDGGNSTTGNPETTTDTTGQGPVTSSTDATTTGPNPTGPTVYCNDLPCADGEICCWYAFAIGKDFCADSGECPDFEGWTELQCNGPDDCPDAECCGTWTEQTSWIGSECASSCNGGNQYELCFGDPGTCDVGTCKSSMSLGVGYSFCGE